MFKHPQHILLRSKQPWGQAECKASSKGSWWQRCPGGSRPREPWAQPHLDGLGWSRGSAQPHSLHPSPTKQGSWFLPQSDLPCRILQGWTGFSFPSVAVKWHCGQQQACYLLLYLAFRVKHWHLKDEIKLTEQDWDCCCHQVTMEKPFYLALIFIPLWTWPQW